ncbi:MAG: ribosome biogenesis GTP-binding protein YihA/YsxC [Pseudomonadota bacterium]
MAMKGGTWTFLLGVRSMDQLPAADLVEVAFAGRSNVGKSSLINAVTRKKGLARTSNTPGRTQELNFFLYDDPAFRIVDLPGYGYAAAPKSAVDAWTRLTNAYLRGRPNLRRVFLLIDARHGLKANDLAVMDALDSAAVAYQVVLTKSDKVKPPALAAVETRTTESLAKRPAAHPEILMTSSEKGDGIDAVRDAIRSLLVVPRDDASR